MPDTSANSSATRGAVPIDAKSPNRRQIEDLLFPVIQTITQLPEEKLYPSYQFVPPSAPAMEEDWASFYVRPIRVSNLPQTFHDSRGDGSDVIVEEYFWELNVTFIGPSALENAQKLRAGLFVEQNRWDTIMPYRIEFTHIGSPVYIPYLENAKWLDRADLSAKLTQIATYVAPIRNLLSGHGNAVSDNDMGVSFDSDNARIKE